MLLFAFGGLRSFGICAGSANKAQYDTSAFVMKSPAFPALLQSDICFGLSGLYGYSDSFDARLFERGILFKCMLSGTQCG